MADRFVLHSEFKPTGDQPEAIERLAAGVENGLKEQVLLGVTGSGKTFTMASVIEKLNRVNERVYTMKDAEAVLSKITDIQRRRYLLYEVCGLSTPQIALSEGVNQNAVWESITAAKSRIKKILKNF